MELWWNLDILWWNLDRFEHKFDGNITNWPCWSEGKLGTGPFTWLGQGFHTNFLEIPFQKGEKRHFDGLSIARKIGLILTPVFCNASRNKTLVVIRSGSKIFKTFAPGAPLAFSGWVGIPRKFRKIKPVTRLAVWSPFWCDQKILCSCFSHLM